MRPRSSPFAPVAPGKAASRGEMALFLIKKYSRCSPNLDAPAAVIPDLPGRGASLVAARSAA